MNRKKKSSIILIVIIIVLSPLIFKAYEYSKKLDKKVKQMEVMADNMMTETKSKMKNTLIGKWVRKDKQQEVWEFTSDSTITIDKISYIMDLEMNLIIIEKKEPQILMCIIENDSTLKLNYIKTELNDFFDKQEFFQLIKD